MTDPRLDRIVQFDERSRAFPVRALLSALPQRSYTWRCEPRLDQGQEGACVGFAWAHELAARPAVYGSSAFTAVDIYQRAQLIDEWAGEDYSGTSVLAGAKIVSADGHVPEYRWAFGLEDLIYAVGHMGPAVLGVNWYSGMFDPNDKGYLEVKGDLAGGHAILCHGVNIKGQYFKLHNSWGKNWGVDGECRISFADMSRLLQERGEACVPVSRKWMARRPIAGA